MTIAEQPVQVILFANYNISMLRYWYVPFRILRRAGIRGPRPTVIVGNVPEIRKKVSIFSSLIVVLYQQTGETNEGLSNI